MNANGSHPTAAMRRWSIRAGSNSCPVGSRPSSLALLGLARRRQALSMAGDAPGEEDQGGEEHPPRPEVTARSTEEPDQDRDGVDEAVLEGERAPPRVARAHRRQTGIRQLPECVRQLRLR